MILKVETNRTFFRSPRGKLIEKPIRKDPFINNLRNCGCVSEFLMTQTPVFATIIFSLTLFKIQFSYNYNSKSF